jgi:hypothetical protein
MKMPPIKVDWTINPSVIGAALLFAFSALASWYNLKEEVHILKATTEQKFVQVDSTMSEIKTEVKDLRSDLKLSK